MNPKDENVALDQQMASKSLETFYQVMSLFQSSITEFLDNIVKDLYNTANKAVNDAKLESLNSNLDVSNFSFGGGDTDAFGQELGFPVLLTEQDDQLGWNNLNSSFNPFLFDELGRVDETEPLDQPGTRPGP